jgi:hypothetical protein
MSTQESREISELRRKNLSLFERVAELKVALGHQIKVDSGKASSLGGYRELRPQGGQATAGTKRVGF